MSNIDYSRWEHINASESDTETDEGVMVTPAENMSNLRQSDTKDDSLPPNRFTKFEKLRSAARKFIHGRDHNDEENEEIIDIPRHYSPYPPSPSAVRPSAMSIMGGVSRILPFVDSYDIPMDTATDAQSQHPTHTYSNSNTNPSQCSSEYGFLTQFNASALSLYQVERELDVLCSVLQLPQLLCHYTRHRQRDLDMSVRGGGGSTYAGAEDANEERVLQRMIMGEDVVEAQVNKGEPCTATGPNDQVAEEGWDAKSSVEGVLPPWMKVHDLSELQRTYVHDAYMQLLAHSAEWQHIAEGTSPPRFTDEDMSTSTDMGISTGMPARATCVGTTADTVAVSESSDSSTGAEGSASGASVGSRLCLCTGTCECEEMAERDIDWDLLLQAQALLARREKEDGDERRNDGKKSGSGHVNRDRLEKEEGLVRERENSPIQSRGKTEKAEKFPPTIPTGSGSDSPLASSIARATREGTDLQGQVSSPFTSTPALQRTSHAFTASLGALGRENHGQARLDREATDVALRRMRAVLRTWLEQRTSTIRLALTRARSDTRIYAPSIATQTLPRTDTQLHSPLSLGNGSPIAVTREEPLSPGERGLESSTLTRSELAVSGDTVQLGPSAVAHDRSSAQIDDVRAQTSTKTPDNAPSSGKLDIPAQESVNGGVEDGVYLWRQDREHAWVSLWVPANTRAKDVRVSVQDGVLLLSLRRDTLLQGLEQGTGMKQERVGGALHHSDDNMRNGGNSGDNSGGTGDDFIVDQEHPDFFLWFCDRLAYPVRGTLEIEGEEGISSSWSEKTKIRKDVTDANSANIAVKRGVRVCSSTTIGMTSVASATMTTSSRSTESDTTSSDTLGDLEWELRNIPGHTERLVTVQFRKCAPPGLRIWWRKATVSGKEISVEQISGRSGLAVNLLPALSGKVILDNEKELPLPIHNAKAGRDATGSKVDSDGGTDFVRPRELGGFEKGQLSDISHTYGEKSIRKAVQEKENSHQGFESVWADAHAQLKQYVANLVPVMVEDIGDDWDDGAGNNDRRKNEDICARGVDTQVQEPTGREEEGVARSRASTSTRAVHVNKPAQ